MLWMWKILSCENASISSIHWTAQKCESIRLQKIKQQFEAIIKHILFWAWLELSVVPVSTGHSEGQRISSIEGKGNSHIFL